MLEGLVGNQSVQKILLFLFVNGKCYGTELHRSLKVALTPIQKALDRLERGGILSSYFEGKTKLYQFNPAYPLLNELQELLKKAYTLLPAEIKKEYYVMQLSSAEENKDKTLLACWERLKNITRLQIHAKRQWKGKGEGEVSVVNQGFNQILFHEKGHWKDKEACDQFSNVFRWTLDRNTGVISLEHLRRGPEHPVFLFHLAPSGKNNLTSLNAHLCGGDVYFGQLHFDISFLRLHWRVIGPKKNEEIDYYYR